MQEKNKIDFNDIDLQKVHISNLTNEERQFIIDDNDKIEEKHYKLQYEKMQYGEDKCFYIIRLVIVCIAVFLAFAIVIIYLIHLTCPMSWRWLCKSEVTQIKDLAISIIVGLTLSIATTYFFKMKK